MRGAVKPDEAKMVDGKPEARTCRVAHVKQTARDKHRLLGVSVENVAAKYPDFAPSLTEAELAQAHNRDPVSYSTKNPAFALSLSRMQAAGFGH